MDERIRLSPEGVQWYDIIHIELQRDIVTIRRHARDPGVEYYTEYVMSVIINLSSKSIRYDSVSVQRDGEDREVPETEKHVSGGSAEGIQFLRKVLRDSQDLPSRNKSAEEHIERVITIVTSWGEE